MNKKILSVAILAILVLVVAPVVFAQKFVVRAFPDDFGPNIDDFYVSELNYYTLGTFDGVSQQPYSVQFLDSSDRIIADSDLLTGSTSVDFSKDIAKIKVLDGSDPLFEKVFSLCDADGICEPCQGANCSLKENSLTCDDCPSGSEDYFCDLVKDGVCDPDCDGIDIDCEGYNVDKTYAGESCADLGGIFCSGDEICKGGYFATSLLDDGAILEKCCVGGSCQVDWYVDVSSLNETELEEYNGSIEDAFEGIDVIDENTPGTPDSYEEAQEESSERAPPDDLILEDKPDTLGNLIIVVIILTLLLVVLMIVVKGKSPEVHSQVTSDYIAKDIQSMYAKGLDEGQIRQTLLNKGYPIDAIDSELKKVFNAR